MCPVGAQSKMITYIVFNPTELSEDELSDRLPDGVAVTDYTASMEMAGIRVPDDADPLEYMEIGEAVAALPGGRFPTFSVMGTNG